MIDKRHIGKVFPLHTAEVEKTALDLIARKALWGNTCPQIRQSIV
jgi:hypothetical protein